MPLPHDPKLLRLSDELVDTMRATFETPTNYRPGTTVFPKVQFHALANKTFNSPCQGTAVQGHIHSKQRRNIAFQSTNLLFSLNTSDHAIQY